MNVATATASSCVPMYPVLTPVRATRALPLTMMEDHAKVWWMTEIFGPNPAAPLKLAYVLE